MDYQTVIVEKKGHVGITTMNRPDRLNTMNTQLARELGAVLKEMEEDKNIRVIIIKGAGRAFCAGIDLSEFHNKTALEYREWTGLMDNMTKTIACMNKPVIAAVHGYATANGAGLVAACDLAIASEDARFGTTAISVGLYCFGPSNPLVRSIGRKRSLNMLLTGDLITAQEAERFGLINKVVPQEDLENAAMELAERLASKSPIAMQMGKRSFYTMEGMDYDKASDYLAEAFSILCSTEDAKEGVNAFLEKRGPVWKEH